MKKYFLAISTIVFALCSNAQYEVFPNGGFENWPALDPFELPSSWYGMSLSPQNSMIFWYSNDAHSGNYSVKLDGEVVVDSGDTLLAFNNMTLAETDVSFYDYNEFLPANHIKNVYPGFGVDFTSRPDSLVGWFKYFNPDALIGQEFEILVLLSKWNPSTNSTDVISEIKFYHGPTNDNFNRFSIPFNYLNTFSPDTLRAYVCGLQSRYLDEHIPTWSTIPNGIGTVVPITLYLDDIQFVYNEIAAISEKENLIEVYPNPVNSKLNINLPCFEKFNYELVDMNGKIMKCGELFNQHIEVSELVNGVYFLKVKNDLKSYDPIRLIIQH